MTEHDRVSISRRNTPEGERVVFIKGTEILTEIPTEIIREAAAFVTKFGNKRGGAGVTFTVDGTYKAHVGPWDSKVLVTLTKFGEISPLGVWDIIEVDPF